MGVQCEKNTHCVFGNDNSVCWRASAGVVLDQQPPSLSTAPPSQLFAEEREQLCRRKR